MFGYHLRELKIEVTRSCPLRCLHCSSDAGPGCDEALPLERVTSLIAEFASLGGERLYISGGEPLGYGDLLAVVRAACEAGLRVSLYTSGVLHDGPQPQGLSAATAAFLADAGVRTIFSLHGAYASTHDMISGVPGSFDTTVEAIRKAVAAGVRVELHVVPMAPNFSELGEIGRIAAALGVQRVSWLRFVPQGRGAANRSRLELGQHELARLPRIKMDLQVGPTHLAVRTGAPFNILCPKQPPTCEAAVSELTIGPDGAISPCDALKRFRLPDPYGNILEHSLAEIWQNSNFLMQVRALHDSMHVSPCTTCPSYSSCGSGCLAQRAVHAGKLGHGRDPDCLMRKVPMVRREPETIAVR